MGTFPARYKGPCAADCGSLIEPGEDVRYLDDELVHADCDGKREMPWVAVCPKCHIAHAGECY